MADTTDTAAPSPFLALPGELRNEIYRMTIIQPQAVHALTSQTRTDPPHTPYKLRVPALALVCREIRDEVLSIYYAENTFIFRTSTYCDQREIYLHRSNLAWFEKIDKHVKNVKSIRVRPGPGHVAQYGGVDIEIEKGGKVRLTPRPHTRRSPWPLTQFEACKCAAEQAGRRFTADLRGWASRKDVLQKIIAWCALGEGSQYIGDETRGLEHCRKCDGWRQG